MNKENWTPFLLSCKKGLLQIVEKLASQLSTNELNVMRQSKNGLDLACENQHFECIAFLISKGFVTKNFLMQSISKNGDIYKKYLNLLDNAIRSKDLKEVILNIKPWPSNVYFFIYHEGKSYKGTLLHLLLSLCDGCEKLDEIVFLNPQ